MFQGRFLYECILLREGHQRVFLNLRRMHKYGNLPLHEHNFLFLASFQFHKKEIFPWEHIKLGELHWHNTPGFFCWGRSLKIHIKIKRELFMD
jgi:hypothetical protein